jgi:PPOX class probable F420-dependent enzyme
VSIRLSDDEAWAFLEQGHTGVLTTLRADGRPVSLPVWFVVLDRVIYTQTPAGAKKAARVQRDPRAAFLVETGTRWTELSAVHLEGRAEIVSDPDEAARASAALGEKYEAFGMPRAEVPHATKQHYRAATVIRIVPDGKVLTWDNARVRLRREPRPATGTGP